MAMPIRITRRSWPGLTVVIMILAVGAGSARADSFDSFLEPLVSVDVASPARDRLKKVLVEEGDQVKKGQVLAELDTNVLEAALAVARARMKAQGRILSARAMVLLHAERLARLEELAETGNVTADELRRARADAEVSRARLQEAEEEQKVQTLEYEHLVARIEEKRLRSPVNGVVVRVFAHEEELVGATAEDAVIMTVVQLDPLRAVFHLPVDKAASLAPGRGIHVRVAGRDSDLKGVVSFVSPVVEPESGLVRVAVDIDNPGGKVPSGLACSVGME